MSAKWGRKSVILFLLQFEVCLLWSGKSMTYIRTANRTIERSPNVAAIGADYRD